MQCHIFDPYRGGSYGILRVYYATLTIGVQDLVNISGIKPLDLFSSPLTGVPSGGGSQVDVSQVSDPLQVRF